MNIKIHKTYGKHPNIGWWCVFTLVPAITVARSCDFISQKPVYSIAIDWLFWNIEINNNKSY